MSLKNIQNISFDDLKRFISYVMNLKGDDLRDFVNEKQTLVLYSIIIIGSLVGFGFTLQSRVREHSDYKAKAEMLLAKEPPIREYESVLKDRKTFIQTIPPPLSDGDLILFITETATGHNIQINSFEPVRRTSAGFFRSRSVSLICSGNTFKDALAFVQELEETKYFIKVNSWSITSSVNDFELMDKQHADTEAQLKAPLIMALDVASIALVDNDKKNIQKN